MLWNVLQAAVKKPGLQQAKEQIAFEEFKVIKGPAQLEGDYKEWRALITEVRWSPWCSVESVLDSAAVVLQRFQPMLKNAG